MKKTFILLIITLSLSSVSLFAQGPGGGMRSKVFHQEIESLKIAHITQCVGLTAEEAVTFWPLYNRYWDKKRELHRSMRGVCRDVELEGGQATQQLARFVDLNKQQSDLVAQAARDFGTVLDSERVLRVFIAEQSFKRILLEKRKDLGHH